MRFSANLGFLWADRPLPDAIRAAKAAGFDAVECHWPYATPAAQVKAALDETGLAMLGLNAGRGDVAAGENGLTAVPGREVEARTLIDEALAYAQVLGTRNVHVMAGYAAGPLAHATYLANLGYACERAAGLGITILIEPLNHYDAPGYFLTTTDQAIAVLDAIGAANLKLMFDVYHVQIMEGDVSRRVERLLPRIGHIQIASVPNRGAPDHGEIAFTHVFALIRELGWSTPIGAEYKPGGDTDATLGWLKPAQAARAM